MRLIGGKWKSSILWHRQKGPVRFNELARRIAGANRKMIDSRLKEMEEHGLVHREVLTDRPIAVEYSMTPLGKEAIGVLRKLEKWISSNDL